MRTTLQPLVELRKKLLDERTNSIKDINTITDLAIRECMLEKQNLMIEEINKFMYAVSFYLLVSDNISNKFMYDHITEQVNTRLINLEHQLNQYNVDLINNTSVCRASSIIIKKELFERIKKLYDEVRCNES